MTGLVGSSGGGKSTLAQLLLRFYETGEGKIRIGGVDIRDISQEQLTHIVSYVFQESFLFHDTVENNIRMGDRSASIEQVEEAAKNAGIHEVIMRLPQGYQTVIGEKDAYLSGGEKQRVAIARVFLRNTPIVVLDEATSSLDPENEVLIQQAISALVEEKTVVVIAHRLQSVSNADQIVVLEDGNVSETGTHEELLGKKETYCRLWQEQQNAGSWQIKA